MDPFFKVCVFFGVLWHVYMLYPLLMGGLTKQQEKFYKIGFLCFPLALLNVVIVTRFIRNPLLRTVVTMMFDALLIILVHRVL